jgi:hypothetical protein
MSELAFISPGSARPEGGFTPRASSPLARALAGAKGIRDLSPLGKLEVRGRDAIGELSDDVEVIPITSARALVLCPPERVAELRRSLTGLVIDLTGALAGIEVDDPRLLSRLTDLDPDSLPAVGRVAGVLGIVTAAERGFRIFFAQELGDSVVEAVRDLEEGLA